MKIMTQRKSGFTLIEILIVVVTIALVVFLLIPMLTRSTRLHKRLGCTNNLKHVGLAARMWSNDNNDQFPWVSTNSAGSRAFANAPQVFQHFAAMSNELITPKVLVCPQDLKRMKTTNFTSFSNTNVSYFVGLDADEAKPERLLSGDRNITGGIFTNGFLRLLKTNTLAGWTKELHDYGGNIGLSDGSVQQMTAQQLQQQLRTNTLPTIRLAIP
jgi:competence protein ComGC